MKAILTPLILILAVIGGAVGGDFMKSRKADALNASASHSSDKSKSKSDKKSHGDKKDKKKDKKADKKKDKKKGGKKGDKKDGHGDTGSDSISYLKFKRQFVVPVLERGRIDSLVIMNFNIELGEDAPDNVYSYEPKLRDAIMRELLLLSNEGLFGDTLTSPDTYDVIRDKLLDAIYAVVPSGIKDLLILDIARQDQ